jgi:septum formation protein
VTIRLVLASASPRRAEILGRLGISYAVRPPEVAELVRFAERPEDAARRLALEKAEAIRVESGELILAADTIVALGEHALGKPANPADAVEMLQRLSGRVHHVFTGLALKSEERVESGVECTRVRFRTLARSECEEYVATGESADKAGAYGIQGRGSALVEGIDGDFFNVMGLPVQLFLRLLDQLGLRYDFEALVRDTVRTEDE